MQAGRELDAVIAEKVMGYVAMKGETIGWNDAEDVDEWFMGKEEGIKPYWGSAQEVPRYSTDAAEALEILDRFDTWHIHRRYDPGFGLDGGDFYTEAEVTRFSPESFATARAETVPLAICLAVLQAVEAVRLPARERTPE